MCEYIRKTSYDANNDILYVTFEKEKYSKYKVSWEQIFQDDIGRRYAKIKKVCTYNSIEEMEADVAGFLCFIEYEEEIDLDAEVEYDEADL